MNTLQDVNILVVDDDEDTLDLECMILEREGAHLRCVTSVAEAVDALREFKADLILTDLAMPGEDGYELIRQVHAAAKTHDLPVAVISAHGDQDTRAQVLAAGAVSFMVKPLSPDALVGAVAGLVQ